MSSVLELGLNLAIGSFRVTFFHDHALLAVSFDQGWLRGAILAKEVMVLIALLVVSHGPAPPRLPRLAHVIVKHLVAMILL